MAIWQYGDDPISFSPQPTSTPAPSGPITQGTGWDKLQQEQSNFQGTDDDAWWNEPYWKPSDSVTATPTANYSNPYPVPETFARVTGPTPQPDSTSSPASASAGQSSGGSSIPTLNQIPHAEQIKSLLTLKSMGI